MTSQTALLQNDSEIPLHLSLLGPPRVVHRGEQVSAFRTSKSQALLFYLAVTGRVQRRSTLADLLWPEASVKKASASLRTALSNLNMLLGEHLEITRQSVSLLREGLWLDVAQFDNLLKSTKSKETDIWHMQAAASLYGGDFLQGFHVRDAPQFEQWMTVERERLREAILNTLLALAVWHAQQRDFATGLDHLTRLLAIEPTSEAGHRQKMAILAQMGQRSPALQQYEACRRILAEELSVEPAPETVALYELILAGAMEAKPLPGVKALHAGETTPLYPARERREPRSPPGAPELPRIDRADMPDRSSFYGRQEDLTQVGRWLTTARAGLVAITGMGGVGKTALAVEVLTRLAPGSYDLVAWRSLVNAPPLITLLDSWLLAMAEQHPDRLPGSLDEKLALLFAELQRQRCLLVLDNAESIMQAGSPTGRFRRGYENYDYLLDRMARSRHQSCLLLTTRELPRVLERLEEDYPRVRNLALEGLALASGVELLEARGVTAPEPALESLVERYSGNPLALKLVADTVRDLFGGDVKAFLGDETPVFDDISDVLGQQFARLSVLEREIVNWLAIEREPVPVQALWNNLVHPPKRGDFLEAMRSLQRGSLVDEVVRHEKDAAPHLALPNVVLEYTTDCLVRTLCHEIESGQADWLHRHALVKAHSREFVQESQRRLLLQPIARWLVGRWGQSGAVQRLRDLLELLRQQAAQVPSYAGANVLHLLLYLQGSPRGFDFSQLAIRQADLRNASLVDVDMRGADLEGSTFSDTFGAVKALAVSPDGQHLAAASTDGNVFLWQMAAYQPHHVLQGHRQPVSSVAFSPDGTMLASGGFDNRICLWEVETGQLIRSLQGHSDTIGAVVFSRDGTTLASAGSDSCIFLWDWQTGEIRRRLQKQSTIYGLAFSPNGQTLASVNDGGEAHLWDWHAGKLLETLRGHEDTLHGIAFSPDGAMLATGGEDGHICLWQLADCGAYHVLDGHGGWVLSLAFSPDGKRLASASTDQTVRIWDVGARQSERTLFGHTNWASAVAYSPDGATVVSGGYDQAVLLWDVRNGQLSHRLGGYSRWVNNAKFSPDGRLLVSSGLDGPARLWEVSSGQLLHTLRGHRGAIRTMSFGLGSRLIAGGCDDHGVYLWDTDGGALKQTLRGHQGMVRNVLFSPDDRHLITASHDETVRLWEVATSRLHQVISEASTLAQSAIAVHPDGHAFAYGTLDGTVKLVDVPSGHLLESMAVGQDRPLVVAVSPQGRLVACGTESGTVWVWDVSEVFAGGRAVLRTQIQPSAQAVWRLLFSADNRLLVWYYEGGSIQVLDLETGQIRYSQSVPQGAFSLAFSREGELLITAGPEHTIKVHDASSGEVRKTLRGHCAQLTCIEASPTEDVIASSSADGTVRLWNLESGHCLAIMDPPGPYAGMNITGVRGITAAQRATLLALGAVESGKDQ